jgi:uncharacterized lipoprotein YajG
MKTKIFIAVAGIVLFAACKSSSNYYKKTNCRAPPAPTATENPETTKAKL